MDVENKQALIKVKPNVKQNLELLKVHKNQSYSEVVEGLLTVNKCESLHEFWENVKKEVNRLRDQPEGSQSTANSG